MEGVTVLPVVPWMLAAVSFVLVVALGVPPGGPRQADVHSGRGSIAARLGAAVAASAAVTAVVIARFGPENELDNPVPALVVGLGWPLLLLLPGLVGLLRPRTRGETDVDAPSRDVRPAVFAAATLVVFFTVPYTPTRSMSVAYVIAAYATVVAAAAVAFGRARVAARFEVLGLLAAWGAVGRALPRWAAPRGALSVLAIVLGGAWFERYERTTRWTEALPDRLQSAVGLASALALAAAGAALLHRAVRPGPTGTAAATLLPLVLATAAAAVMRRALISVQLLLYQATGPGPITADPLGIAGGQGLALATVAVGGALSAAVLARRMEDGAARLPGVAVVLALTGASAWLVLQP